MKCGKLRALTAEKPKPAQSASALFLQVTSETTRRISPELRWKLEKGLLPVSGKVVGTRVGCESNKLKAGFAAIRNGVSRTASNKAFVVGVGTGISGAVVGAALIANRQRITNLFRRQKTGERRPISLAEGAAQKPTAIPIPGMPSKPPASSGGAIPIPGMPSRPPASSGGPIPIPGIPSKPPASHGAIPIPGIPSKPPTSTGVGASSTHLHESAITIRESDGNTKRINGYEVLRPSGGSTGLAITPYQSSDKNGNDSSNEQAQTWGVTHMNTGMLIDGPFSSVSQAHGLATQLSTLRWTALSIPEQDVTKAQQIVTQYRQSLGSKS